MHCHVQVAPSFFDAPGAQAAGRVTTRQGKGPTVPASFSSQYNPLANPNTSPTSTQRFSQDLPDIAFAFASEHGFKASCLTSSSHDIAFAFRYGERPPGKLSQGLLSHSNDTAFASASESAHKGSCLRIWCQSDQQVQ